jgi:phosphohistidine phosphatase SixA
MSGAMGAKALNGSGPAYHARMRRMHRRRHLVLIAVVATAGCATCPDAVTPSPSSSSTSSTRDAPAPAGARTIVFVRHAEKASDGSDDPPLTEAGEARAQCLVTMLRAFGTTHVLATQYRRTQATAEPLAEAMGLPLQVIDAGDGDGWSRAFEALPAGARAVVVGHSNSIPQWVTALGGEPGELDDQGNIPHEEYGRMIVLVRAGDESVASVLEYCSLDEFDGKAEKL